MIINCLIKVLLLYIASAALIYFTRKIGHISDDVLSILIKMVSFFYPVAVLVFSDSSFIAFISNIIVSLIFITAVYFINKEYLTDIVKYSFVSSTLIFVFYHLLHNAYIPAVSLLTYCYSELSYHYIDDNYGKTVLKNKRSVEGTIMSCVITMAACYISLILFAGYHLLGALVLSLLLMPVCIYLNYRIKENILITPFIIALIMMLVSYIIK